MSLRILTHQADASGKCKNCGCVVPLYKRENLHHVAHNEPVGIIETSFGRFSYPIASPGRDTNMSCEDALGLAFLVEP